MSQRPSICTFCGLHKATLCSEKCTACTLYVDACHTMLLREMERRDKVEEARRETERILAAQEAEVQQRKARLHHAALCVCWVGE